MRGWFEDARVDSGDDGRCGQAMAELSPLFKRSAWVFPDARKSPHVPSNITCDIIHHNFVQTKCFRYESVSTSLPRLRAMQQPNVVAFSWLDSVT